MNRIPITGNGIICTIEDKNRGEDKKERILFTPPPSQSSSLQSTWRVQQGKPISRVANSASTEAGADLLGDEMNATRKAGSASAKQETTLEARTRGDAKLLWEVNFTGVL